MNNKELKKKECLFEIVDDLANGMDIYNHNGSFWLINTKELKWMIEFTKDKTLWYNYNIFKSLFKAMSLDVMENQVYITEWFESRFLNVYTVKTTVDPFFDQDQYVEDTIQNGVKYTKNQKLNDLSVVEDTIQNGVKHTEVKKENLTRKVEDTIENGVKHTWQMQIMDMLEVEDVIQNGVMYTSELNDVQLIEVKDTIQNGVKRTNMDRWNGRHTIDNTIKNGVKINGTYVGGKRQKENVEVVIDYGVKETYDDCSNNIARVEGIVRIGGVIQNGVKHTEYGDWLDGDERIGDITQNGIKRTKGICGKREGRVGNTIENGLIDL